jgi:hypothetical protein
MPAAYDEIADWYEDTQHAAGDPLEHRRLARRGHGVGFWGFS